MSLPRDLVEMLSEFERDGVRYLVIGGHAVSFHARPRSTKDLDVWLDEDADNIERACTALQRFGLPPAIIESLRNARPDEIVWAGRAPSRVDFLRRIPGVEFADAWTRRVVATIGGARIIFIGRIDLIENKRAVARPQDLRDARALERVESAAPKRRRKPRT